MGMGPIYLHHHWNRWVEWALPKHVFEISLSFFIPFLWCRFTVKRGSTDSLKKKLFANLDSALFWRVEYFWVLYKPPDFFFPKNWMLRLKASNFSILEMSNWYSNFELPKPSKTQLWRKSCNCHSKVVFRFFSRFERKTPQLLDVDHSPAVSH